MQPNSFAIGQRVSFVYNNIRRDGVVERVNAFGLTIKLDNDRHGRTHKSFLYAGMQPVTEIKN